MDGQSVTYAVAGPAAKAMTVCFDVLSGTRYWELEPYFDIDNGRALALEDVEYLVYIEKPGPIELIVENHAYDVFWINPADGETIRRKFSGDHFTAEPPDRSHDWVLHVVRLSHLESMNKSYKFESREDPIALQEIEANTPKVPFTIEQPTGDLSVSQPAPYSAKLTHETRATRTMMVRLARRRRFRWPGLPRPRHRPERHAPLSPRSRQDVSRRDASPTLRHERQRQGLRGRHRLRPQTMTTPKWGRPSPFVVCQPANSHEPAPPAFESWL